MASTAAAALAPLLSRLELGQWSEALEREALDVESLALASAVDVRLVVGLPLGKALRLVYAARSLTERLCEEELPPAAARLPRPVAQPSEGAAPVPSAPAQAPAPPSPAAPAQPAPVWRLVPPRCCRSKEHAEDSDELESGSSADEQPQCEVEKDHQISFKHALYLAKSSAELKAITMNLTELWLISLTLFIGTLAAIWSLLPDDHLQSAPAKALAFEVLCSLSFATSFASIGLFAAVYLSSAAVDPANFKAFLMGVLGPVQLAEYSRLVAFFTLCAAVTVLSAVRIEAYKDVFGWGTALSLGLSVPQAALLVASRAGILIVGRLAMHSGALGSAPVLPSNASDAPQGEEDACPPSAACAFRDVWEAARRSPSDLSAFTMYRQQAVEAAADPLRGALTTLASRPYHCTCRLTRRWEPAAAEGCA